MKRNLLVIAVIIAIFMIFNMCTSLTTATINYKLTYYEELGTGIQVTKTMKVSETVGGPYTTVFTDTISEGESVISASGTVEPGTYYIQISTVTISSGTTTICEVSTKTYTLEMAKEYNVEIQTQSSGSDLIKADDLGITDDTMSNVCPTE